MEFESWKSDLEKVLPELQRVVLGSRSVKILTIGDRIAFGLPENRQLASDVVNLYRPMKLKARGLAGAIKGCVKFGGLSFLKSWPSGEEQSQISWLNGQADIGFLGCNPGHGLRCIVLSGTVGGSTRVTKVAIGENNEPIVIEAENLRRISGQYPGVPALGGCETGADWAAYWTRYIPGAGPTLLRGSEVVDLLEGWIRPAEVVLEHVAWLKPILNSLPDELSGGLGNVVVRTALMHGDFTSWNLRRDGAQLLAIDWEWAQVEGVGGLDLGHGLVMEAKLVRGQSGANLVDEILRLAGEGGFQTYLRSCGWRDLNKWMALSLGYASHRTGVDVKLELEILKNRVELAASI